MGRIILQMMISLDGMVSGPNGEMDWIAGDESLQQEHLARLEQADAVIMGAAMYPGLYQAWSAIAADEKSGPVDKAIGHAMNKTPNIVYSHKDITVDREGDEVHVVKDDEAFVEDIKRLKQKIKGTIVCYGGVRFARSLIQQGLLDEIHLDICPVIMGIGQPLFTDLKHSTNLRLRESVSYDSGATMVHYEVVKAS